MMDPKDKDAILQLKDRSPKTIAELHVRQFLGFIGYFRKYIPNFSRRAKTLYDLLVFLTRRLQITSAQQVIKMSADQERCLFNVDGPPEEQTKLLL